MSVHTFIIYRNLPLFAHLPEHNNTPGFGGGGGKGWGEVGRVGGWGGEKGYTCYQWRDLYSPCGPLERKKKKENNSIVLEMLRK